MNQRHRPRFLLPSLIVLALYGCSAASDGESSADPGAEAALSPSATGTIFGTGGAKLNVRAKPSTASAVVATLSPGKQVKISCQTNGQSINGSSVWDFLPAQGGYVSDAFVHTGHAGFIPGLPKCGASSSGCGDLDYAGECQGDTLRWCEDDAVREKDCAADGRSCGYEDAATGYNCLNSGGGGDPGGPLFVRGVELDSSQAKWVRYIAEHVVPELGGNRSARIEKAAYVSWWSLKEGILNLANPLAYSNCHFPPDQHIGPVDVCPNPNNAWQVGLSAVQAAWRSLADVEELATQVHPEKNISQVLADAAAAAGYGPSSSVGQTVAQSSGRLRLSWLLRDAAVGFEAEYPVVHGECFVTCSGGWENTCAWCFGSGWDTSASFAPSRAASEQAVADLIEIYDALSP